MHISRVALVDLDLALVSDLAVVRNAGLAEVTVPEHTGESLLMELTKSDEPPSAFWIARDGDAVVGYAGLTEPIHEYADAAFLGGAVTPSAQGEGIGRALLGEAIAGTERAVLRTRAYRGTTGAKALPALGFSRTMTHGVRRLVLADPIPEELCSSVVEASDDYDLVRRVGPTPETDLPEMMVLREAINDAPDALEWEAYPPERIAAYEQSLIERKQTQFTIIARHRATGEPAGLTMVCVHELRPQVAAQEDTSVLPAHRGRRLGLRLKLEMADWLRAERPDVDAVDTWNDATNAPMIAVNQQLGARIVAENSVYRRAR